MPLRPCISCSRPIGRGTRCPDCVIRRPSGSRWRAIRQQVLERDAYRCSYCGGPASTVDHLRPVSEGGSHGPDGEGLVAACNRCNASRRDGGR